MFSGPETGNEAKTGKHRKADGKLTFSGEFSGSWHEKLTLLVTHFSLLIFGYPFRGH